MIRIKDLIINENEIVYIEEFDAQSLGIMFKGKDKAIFIDAHPEDIEWNYGGQPSKEWLDMYRKLDENNLELMEELENKNKMIKELEEENEKLKAEVDLLNDNGHFLNNKIDKAIKCIKKNKENSKSPLFDFENFLNTIEKMLKEGK